MKPIERFQALLDGKKIRGGVWLDCIYIYLHEFVRVRCVQKDGQDSPFTMFTELFDPNIEWELYEEPKPGIKLTPEDVGRVVKRDDGTFGVIIEYHPHEKRFSTLGHWFDENGNGILGHGRSIVEVYR